MSDAEKHKLATQLGELSKTSSTSAKTIALAEATVEQGDYTMGDIDLLIMNLERLKSFSFEAEEVLLMYNMGQGWLQSGISLENQ